MKKRTGFVSNSSSSSFIISKEYDKKEIHDFIYKELVDATERKIAEVKERGDKNFFTNWEEWIEMLKEDLSDEKMEYNINISTIQEYLDKEYDLSEWYNLSEMDMEDLILYDNDDNFLNWVADEIIKKFNVKDYCLHMG